MHRREFLVGSGVGVAGAVAGCLGIASSNDDGGGENHGTALAVEGGVAYYGREDGFVYAVDLDAQREVWRFDTGGEINLSVATEDGVVYAATFDNCVCAIDMESGDEIWSIDSPRWFPFGEVFAPTVADGVVYFGTVANGYSAIDAASGDEVWSYTPAAKPLFWKRTFSFLSAVAEGMTYVGVDKFLVGLDAETGEEHERFETAGQASSPTADDGVVCVGGGGVLHALDMDVMEERWRVDIGERIWFPTIDGDAVYVPDDGGTFVAVDIDSGEKRWQFETDGELHTPPAFTDSTVFFGGHDGYLYAVDRATGEGHWQYFVGEGDEFAGVAAVPTIHDGLVYLGAPGHTLVTLDAATGDLHSQFSHN